MARCARCDSTNVDYEGYCWSCEYQAPAPAPPPVPQQLVAPPPVPVPVAQPRSAGARALLAVGLVVVAFLSTAGGLLVMKAFKTNADSVAAQVNAAPIASPVVKPSSGRPEDAGTVSANGSPCFPGTWKLMKSEGETQVAGIGTVRFSGSGGRMIFRADATGTWDVDGYTESSVLSGRSVVVVAAGTIDFRYQVRGSVILYTNIVSNAKGAVRVDGVAGESVPLNMVQTGSDQYVCSGDNLTITTHGGSVELTRSG